MSYFQHLANLFKSIFLSHSAFPITLTNNEIERYELVQGLNIFPFGTFKLIGNTVYKHEE